MMPFVPPRIIRKTITKQGNKSYEGDNNNSNKNSFYDNNDKEETSISSSSYATTMTTTAEDGSSEFSMTFTDTSIVLRETSGDTVQGIRQRSGTSKLVRFALSTNRYIEPTIVLSNDDSAAMWWSRAEQKTSRLHSGKIVRDVKTGMLRGILCRLYEACGAGKHNTVLTAAEALVVSRGQARGLERFIFPKLVEDRRRVARFILKMQTSIKTNNNNPSDIARRNELLTTQYQKMSMASRRFAHVLAAGDARVAKELHK